MDDNIKYFYRVNRNTRIPVGDGTVLRCMEDFVDRYENVAIAGPQYFMFFPSREKFPPFLLNSRIYSCTLIRCDVPFRWRGRYNEDTDLSLRILKAGWCTVLFNAFLQGKTPTQLMKGGNTSDFYDKDSRLLNSKMLAAMHPDVTRIVWRYSRWHHHVDYSSFKNNPLVQRKDVPRKEDVDDYGMKLCSVDPSKYWVGRSNIPPKRRKR